MRKVCRDPLLHFLILGLLIAVAGAKWRSSDASHRIEIDQRAIAAMSSSYQQQYGRAPTKEQLDTLIENAIQEEIFYREGLALGLDRDDEIVKRRVVQKYDFLQFDLQPPEDPDDAKLAAFFARNEQAYLVPERATFSHIYFSTDASDDASAQRRADETRKSLEARAIDRAPELGDRFFDRYDYSKVTQADLVRLFGDTEVVHAVFQTQTGVWSGPLKSGYGWHLIRVHARDPSSLPSLSGIRDRVLADYIEQQRVETRALAVQKLVDKYVIVTGDRSS